MQDHVETAAHEIAGALFASELSIEAALANTATLLTCLPAFKSDAQLTVFHAQDVVEETSELVALLSQARRRVGQLHRKMEATQRQIGLSHVAFGPGGKPPEQVEPAIKALRQVA